MIGGGVAASLVNSGRIPVTYDVISGAADKFPGVPKPLRSPAEVAKQSDVIMVAVFDAAQAREVIAGSDGILSAAHDDLTVVLLSTVELKEITELAEICAAEKVGFLDCGVTPGTQAAKNGLIAMVGGNEQTLEYAKPVLNDWARRVVHCGSVGAGMATKIARNVNTYGFWRIVTEAQRLANAAGVDSAKLLEVLEAADEVESLPYLLLRQRSAGDDNKLPGAVGENIARFMEKDLKAAHVLAEKVGVDLPVRDICYDLVKDTLDMEKE
jgi:3-hydroxyisobutyrate dehydrogenase-like beta-hydroxyacid dehydrogenase